MDGFPTSESCSILRVRRAAQIQSWKAYNNNKKKEKAKKTQQKMTWNAVLGGGGGEGLGRI